ncbi:hypothetical protein [Enterovibrio calviensis]|uniref:hypothetical protein n=1 Tax=Enterovibrio calviensis TaxID=91359 RepID=UPI003735756F
MENIDEFEDIYMDEIKTTEDAIKHLQKGMFYKQDRIEEVFYEKFIKLRKKIHLVLENKLEDPLYYDVFVNSILVDCRAIFLENERYKFNSTLQNSYRARHFDEFAQGIDELFNRTTSSGKTLKEVIKSWVDQRVVHYDYLEPEQENSIFNEIEEVIDRGTIGNLFHDILIVAQEYEKVKSAYGSNTTDQFNKILEAFTGR